MRKILVAIALLTAVSASALTGSDGRTFELPGGRVEGSHLTATKRLAGGTTEPLEGICINRRRIDGKTPRAITSDQTAFGLGVTTVDFTFGGATVDRLFDERK